MEGTTTLPTKEYLELLECEKKVNAYNKGKIYFTQSEDMHTIYGNFPFFITTKSPIIKKELKRRQDKIDELKTTLSDTLHKSVKTAFDLEDKIKEKQTKINKLNFENIFLYPLSVLGIAYIISMLTK